MSSKWVDIEYAVMNSKQSVQCEQVTLLDCIKGTATVKQYQEYLRKLTSKIKSKNDHVGIN